MSFLFAFPPICIQHPVVYENPDTEFKMFSHY